MALVRIVTLLATALAAWDAARDARRRLRRLSRRELADIGLHAGDLEIAALLGRRA